MSGNLKNVEAGLDLAEKLQPGRGWVAAQVKASADAPLSIGVDAGTRLSKDLVLFGDAWARPTVGQFGADAGLRVKGNLDLFAGGWADTKGAYSAQAGMKWRF